MKVKVKDTEEIKEVKGLWTADEEDYYPNEVEFLPEPEVKFNGKTLEEYTKGCECDCSGVSEPDKCENCIMNPGGVINLDNKGDCTKCGREVLGEREVPQESAQIKQIDFKNMATTKNAVIEIQRVLYPVVEKQREIIKTINEMNNVK